MAFIERDKTSGTPYDAMRIAEFRSLVIGRFIFIMGLRHDEYTCRFGGFTTFTNAPIAIGIVGLSEFIPADFAGPVRWSCN